MAAGLQPVVAVSHGAGPCFFMRGSPMFRGMDADSEAARMFQTAYPAKIFGGRTPPANVLVISAHYETEGPLEVTTSTKLLYDYSGFPPETYQLEYQTSEDAEKKSALVDKVVELLASGGITVTKNETRGLDHGVFIPLKMILPDARAVSVAQLSVDAGLDPGQHVRVGQLLRPLRADTLLLCSGQSTHNMRAFFDPPYGASVLPAHRRFMGWFEAAMLAKDHAALAACAEQPFMRDVHPRMEHFIPFAVAVGAASEEDTAERLDHDQVEEMLGGLMNLRAFLFST